VSNTFCFVAVPMDRVVMVVRSFYNRLMKLWLSKTIAQVMTPLFEKSKIIVNSSRNYT
jgi:hypothetical protein